MVIRHPSKFFWLIIAVLSALSFQPAGSRACSACRTTFARADDTRKVQNSCVTLLVRGMMKSKSGAT